MSKIKKLAVKTSETEFGEPISLGADAVNVDMADGTSAEEAINNRVTQDFEGAQVGPANPINADTVGGLAPDQLYSDFILLAVPAATGPDGNELYYAEVPVPNMTEDKALVAIQETYETSQNEDAHTAALTWEYLDTAANKVTFYGKTAWDTPFNIMGVIVEGAND